MCECVNVYVSVRVYLIHFYFLVVARICAPLPPIRGRKREKEEKNQCLRHMQECNKIVTERTKERLEIKDCKWVSGWNSQKRIKRKSVASCFLLEHQ